MLTHTIKQSERNPHQREDGETSIKGYYRPRDYATMAITLTMSESFLNHRVEANADKKNATTRRDVLPRYLPVLADGRAFEHSLDIPVEAFVAVTVAYPHALQETYKHCDEYENVHSELEIQLRRVVEAQKGC